eukprot:gene22919-biopygen31551
MAGQLAKNDWNPGNRCGVLADAVRKAVQDGSPAAPIASTSSALTFPGVIKQRGKGRSFIVTLDIGVEVQAGLKSLVPASSQVELEGLDDGDISENELSSDASEEEDEVVDTRKISEDDWREVHVTTCQRMAAGYTEPGPGRLRHVELLDVDPDSAPLMFFPRFLPKKAVPDIVKLTDDRGKQMHRPTWSMDLGDFYTFQKETEEK